jgi:hypothetical protein
MEKLVEDTFYITAKEAARALPKHTEVGKVSFEIAGKYIQEIAIVSTASNLEGFVRWFVCPACQNRVGKLYLPVGEAVFLCRKCHDLAYRAQQLRAFKKPEKAREKMPKKRYTKEDWLREAKAYFGKIGRKGKAVLSGF